MADHPPQHHRPALVDDLTEIIDAAGGVDAPGVRADIAAATAEIVVRAGRARRSGDVTQDSADDSADDSAPDDRARFVDLADRIGLDTLAQLWRDADPVSLPGALWALYLLRQWCHDSGADATHLWRVGEPLAPADAVVAGVAEYPDSTDPSAVRELADAVLGGVYRGDLDVALERAAAFFRVIAAGRRSLAESVGDTAHADHHPDRATRNERAAHALSAAAQRWRDGTLH